MSLALNGTNGVTYNDGTQQSSAPGGKNLIINGNMQIAQRGTSATGITSAGYYTVDRMNLGVSAGLIGTWTESQDTDVPTGQGFSKSLKMDCTTANASLSNTSFLAIQHRFEGQMLQHLKKGTSNAESVTLSFWVKSNKTGTYILELYDSDNNRQISYAYTIDTADTWEKKTITFAGDTTGAFDNDNGRSLDVIWYLVAGSDYTGGTLNTSWASLASANRAVGQVNLADSTSNYINITGVQLEVGDTSTDFEHRPYDMELQRCQRYFIKEEVGGGAVADDDYSINAFGAQYPTTMRAQPTVITTNVQFAGHHSSNPSGVFQQSRQGTSWYWDGTAYRSIGSRVYLTYAASAEL